MPVEGVIAADPFSDIRQTIRRFAWVFYRVPYYPFIPLALVMASLQMRVSLGRFSPASATGRISPRPVFLLHGELDRCMPKSDVRVAGCAREPKELWTIPMAGHGDALAGWRRKSTSSAWFNFFKTVFPIEEAGMKLIRSMADMQASRRAWTAERPEHGLCADDGGAARRPSLTGARRPPRS